MGVWVSVVWVCGGRCGVWVCGCVGVLGVTFLLVQYNSLRTVQ